MKVIKPILHYAGFLQPKNLSVRRILLPAIMIVATTNIMAKETNKTLVNSSNLTLLQTEQQANIIARVITSNNRPLPGVTISQLQVSGKITDESGMPLPGVNVKVKDTNIGFVSGIDGNYTLNLRFCVDFQIKYNLFTFVFQGGQEPACNGVLMQLASVRHSLFLSISHRMLFYS